MFFLVPVTSPPSLADVTCGDGYVEGLVVVKNTEQQLGVICNDGFDHNA